MGPFGHDVQGGWQDAARRLLRRPQAPPLAPPSMPPTQTADQFPGLPGYDPGTGALNGVQAPADAAPAVPGYDPATGQVSTVPTPVRKPYQFGNRMRGAGGLLAAPIDVTQGMGRAPVLPGLLY